MNRKNAAMCLVGFLALTPASRAVDGDTNVIGGDLVLTTSNPAIITHLNSYGMTGWKVFATWNGLNPDNSGSATSPPMSTTYSVVVETDTDGRVYNVKPLAFLDGGGDVYYFAPQDAPAVFTEVQQPSGVTQNFSECVGLIQVHFVDGGGASIQVRGGSMTASEGGLTRAVDHGFPDPSGDVELIVPADPSATYDLRVDFNLNSDPYVDKVTLRVDFPGVVVACDDVVDLYVDVTLGAGGGALGAISAAVDLDDEDEINETGWTFVRAFNGPLGNFRYGIVPGPHDSPNGTAFTLPNLPPSSLDGPTDYHMNVEMGFRMGDRYEYFRSPRLSTPGVTVGEGPLPTLLADQFNQEPFLMKASYFTGDVHLQGLDAAESAGCLQAIDRDVPVGALPTDDLGLLYHSHVGVFGQTLVDPGCNPNTSVCLTAFNGEGKVNFSGGYVGPKEWIGDYEAAVGGLLSQPPDSQASWWRPDNLVLFFDQASADPDHHLDGGIRIANNLIGDTLIQPGETLTGFDHPYCFGEKTITFNITGPEFTNPKITFGSSGTFATAEDFTENEADYSVSVNRPFRGTMTGTNSGQVVMCLPAGEYHLEPETSPIGGGTTDLTPISVKVKCGERSVDSLNLSVALDDLASCPADPNVTVTGTVFNPQTNPSPVTVESIDYNGTAGTGNYCVDPGCGDTPVPFPIPVTLASCQNTITVTAQAESGLAVASNTIPTSGEELLYDPTPPVLTCPPGYDLDASDEGTVPAGGYLPTSAADDCAGSLAVDCVDLATSQPIAEFTAGTTTVSCTTDPDGCGNQSMCEYDVIVRDCTPPPDDMVAWWPLDETAGGVAEDIAGPNDGVHLAGPVPVTGKVAGALSFGGGYVEAPGNASLDFGEEEFSVDAWVRTAATAHQVIVEKRIHRPPVQGFSLFTKGGRLFFDLAGVSYDSGHFVADGLWHHVAVTVQREDTSGVRLYVDGSLVHTGTTVGAGTATTWKPLRIGFRRPVSPQWIWQGEIDEVELFRRVLSPSEVDALAASDRLGKCKCVPPPAPMIGWWTLDENNGATAFDSTASQAHGTLVNGPTRGPGRVGAALDFDGSNDYVEVPGGSLPSIGTGDFSVDAWIQAPDSGSKIMKIVDYRREDSGGNQGFALFLTGGVLAFQLADNDGDHDSCGPGTAPRCRNFSGPVPAIDDGLWHHVAVTVDRDQTDGGRFYLDGALVHTFDPTEQQMSVDHNLPLRIGRRSDASGGHFDGLIDEVELFTAVLDSGTVRRLARAASQGKCRPACPDPIDTDTDGIGDACDNCPGTFNPDQRDFDRDGLGDACDLDLDGDGTNEALDNCPGIPNDQSDAEGDGVGDACDVCPADVDPSQDDGDLDDVGDACDVCPFIYNPSQGGVPFYQTLTADDAATLAWPTPADVRWVRGDLSGVSGYATLDDGILPGATSLSMAVDSPAPGSGFYYLVRPLDCGSWQTEEEAEPQRDLSLP